MSEERDILAARYEKEAKMRMDVLEIQHAESIAQHADFEARVERGKELTAAQTADHRSAIAFRDQWVAAVDRQTAVFERIADALERLARRGEDD